jgi:hypothetical protein
MLIHELMVASLKQGSMETRGDKEVIRREETEKLTLSRWDEVKVKVNSPYARLAPYQRHTRESCCTAPPLGFEYAQRHVVFCNSMSLHVYLLYSQTILE